MGENQVGSALARWLGTPSAEYFWICIYLGPDARRHAAWLPHFSVLCSPTSVPVLKASSQKAVQMELLSQRTTFRDGAPATEWPQAVFPVSVTKKAVLGHPCVLVLWWQCSLKTQCSSVRQQSHRCSVVPALCRLIPGSQQPWLWVGTADFPRTVALPEQELEQSYDGCLIPSLPPLRGREHAVLSKVSKIHLGDLLKVTQTFASSWGNSFCEALLNTVCS